MRDRDAQGIAEVWNISISDQVTSPSMPTAHGHSAM